MSVYKKNYATLSKRKKITKTFKSKNLFSTLNNVLILLKYIYLNVNKAFLTVYELTNTNERVSLIFKKKIKQNLDLKLPHFCLAYFFTAVLKNINK